MGNESVRILLIDGKERRLMEYGMWVSEAFPHALVLPSVDAKGGVDIALKTRPDIIVFSLNLPMREGIEACKSFKENKELRDVPLIFVGGLNDAQYKVQLLNLGVEVFLMQPLNASELIAQIRIWLHWQRRYQERCDEIVQLSSDLAERTQELHATHTATLNLLEDLRTEIETRRTTETALRESEARLRRAELASKSGNWELDFQKGVMMASEGARVLYGFTEGSLFDYEQIRALCVLEHRKMVDAIVKSAIETGDTFEFEYKIRKFNSREIVDLHILGFYSYEKKILYGVVNDITEERKAKEALRASEELYRSIIQASPDSITVTDLEGNMLMISPAGLRGIGANSEEEIIGRSYRDFLVPEEHERAIQLMHLLWAGTPSAPLEFTVIRCDGSLLPVEVNVEFVKDENGEPTAMVFAIRDISERKAAQKILAETESLYRAMVEASPDYISITDLEGRILKASPSAYRKLGLTSDEELVGVKLESFVAKEDLERMKSNYHNRVFNRLKSAAQEYKVRLRNGEEYTLEVSLGLIFDDNHQVVKTVAIGRDITERKQMQEALRQTERRYRSIFEKSHSVMMIVDPSSGQIVSANPAATRFYGYSQQQLTSMTFMDLCVDPAETVVNRISGVTKGLSETITFVQRLSGGAERVIEVSSSPLPLDGKQMIYFIINDVTEKRETEAALRQSEEKYRSLVENSTNGIAIYQNGLFVYVNTAGLKLFGSGNPADLIGKPVMSVIHPDSRQMVIERIRNVALGEYAPPVEEKMYRYDGSIFYAEVSALHTFYNGAPAGQVIVTDITARKIAQDALRESEERYNTFINNNEDMIFVKDEARRYLVANRALGQFFGKKPEELIGKTDEELSTDLSLSIATLSSDMRVLVENNLIHLEDVFGEQYFDTTKFPMALGKERMGIGGILHDITKRKTAEQRLNYVTRLYALLSHINQMILRVKTEDELFEKVSELSIEYGRFKMCWIGTYDEQTQKILSINCKNSEPICVDCVQSVLLTEFNPIAQAFASNEGVYYNNLDTIQFEGAWLENARRKEYRSIFATALTRKGRNFGVLAWYASEVNFFHEEERKLLQDIANDINHALIVFDSELERVTAENALKESEAKYREFVEYSPEAIAIYQNNIVVYVNQECLRIMRASAKEELIGMPVIDFVHPDNREEVIRRMMEVKVGELDVALPVVEEKYIRLDGTPIYVEVKVMPIVLDGQPAAQLTARDITDRKLVEEALEQSRVELKAIYDHAPVMMCVVDGERNIYFANNAFSALVEEVSQESRNSVVGNIIGCLSSHTDPRGCGYGARCSHCVLRLAMEETYQTGKSHRNIEFRSTLQLKSGPVEVSLLGSTAQINNGLEKRVLLCLHDITDRKRAEEALQKSEMLLRTFIDNSPFEIWARDTYGVGILENKKHVDHFGTIVGVQLPPRKQMMNNLVDMFWDINQRAYSGEIVTEEIELFHKGLKRAYQQIVFPIRNSEHIIGVAGFNIDITARKEAEDALKRSQEELSKFAAHLQNIREEERSLLAREIHDDLGQILVAMKIDMGLLRNSVLKNIVPVEYDKVKQRFEELQQLVDNTLKSARRIMTDLRPEVLDLLGLGETIQQYVKAYSVRYNIQCAFENHTDGAELNAQQSVALFRIVQEALTNVAKHAKASHVDIQLEYVDNMIYLTISDNGVGFDMLDSKRTDSYGLLGIKERAVLLNGELTITAAPGKGVSLRLSFGYSVGSLK